jgi:TonB family protein
MKHHHVYRPPRGNRVFNSIVIGLGGLMFTFAVFFIIPLMRKLEQGLAKEKQELVANIAPEPPEEYESPEEELEPEEEPEEPPEMAEAEDDISVEAIDLPDLGAGTGGRVLLNISSALALAGNEDDFGSGEIDQEPTPSSTFDPQVPNSVKKLLAKRGAVRVIVSALVDERGAVSEASVTTSSGIAKLDEAALKALQKWKFKPAIRGGRKARARISQSFNFRVK